METLRLNIELQIEQARLSVEQQFASMYRLLEERKQTSDEAGKVALAAQQTAMRTALEAAEKAVTTALTSAEKAVNKAEIAADKRFENMNEFRAQLSDQASTFMPRTESQVLFSALEAKLTDHVLRADENFATMRGQMDAMRGAQVAMTRLVAIGSAVIGAVGVVWAIIGR